MISLSEQLYPACQCRTSYKLFLNYSGIDYCRRYAYG